MEKIIISECQVGNILKGKKNHKKRGHYIIYIELIDPDNFEDFIGAMITTKDIKNNILMAKNHFNENFENGTACKVTFNNSHLVKAKLHKFFNMGPFELYGNLTEEGITFVKEHINDLHLENWEHHKIRTSKRIKT